MPENGPKVCSGSEKLAKKTSSLVANEVVLVSELGLGQ